jgi:hypothetical protein
MAANTDYGSDLSCVQDLDPRCIVVTGRRLLAEAVARRWITPRGGLIDDPNYGTDVTAYINDDVKPRDLATLASAMSQEAEKDERVNSCDIDIQVPPNGIGAYVITASIHDNDGPFQLVVGVDSVSKDISLLSVA